MGSPACHSVVLPIPAAPSRSRAEGPSDTDPTKDCTRANSPSRPKIPRPGSSIRLHHPPALRSHGRGAKGTRATTVEPDGRCSMISVVAADGAIRERLPDETLLVFLSDTHIGGSSGGDIFDSAAELTMLLEDLHHHEGPVELVLAGDFVDVLRMADV